MHSQLACRDQSRIEQHQGLVAIARLMTSEEHRCVLILRASEPWPRVHAGIHRQCVFKMSLRILPALENCSECPEVTRESSIASGGIPNDHVAPGEWQENPI